MPASHASMAPVELVQYRPAWGAQCFLRMAGVRHVLTNVGYPESDASGPYPAAHYGFNLLRAGDIIPVLSRVPRWDLDAHLTAKQRGAQEALAALVHGVLNPALLFSRYADERTFCEITYPEERSASPWPLGDYYAWRPHGAFARSVASASKVEVSERLRAAKSQEGIASCLSARQRASDAYAVFEHRLSSMYAGKARVKYLFGRAPCTLDAELFGHLMDAMSDPLLRCGLHPSGEFPTLARYFEAILAEYFSDQRTASLVALRRGRNLFAEHAERRRLAYDADGTRLFLPPPQKPRAGFRTRAAADEAVAAATAHQAEMRRDAERRREAAELARARLAQADAEGEGAENEGDDGPGREGGGGGAGGRGGVPEEFGNSQKARVNALEEAERRKNIYFAALVGGSFFLYLASVFVEIQ